MSTNNTVRKFDTSDVELELSESLRTGDSLLARLKTLILSQMHNIKSLSVLVFVNFLVAGLGFVTKVKIANTLGKADFGLFSYGLAIAAYGMVLIQFGLGRTLVRELIHFPKRQGQLVVSSLILRGFMFLLVTLILLFWKFFSQATSDLTWGVVLVVLGNSMLGLELKGVYDSMGQFNRHAIYNLIQRCFYYLAVWLIIILAPKSFSVFSLGIFTIAAVIVYMVLQCNWAFKRIDFNGTKESIFHNALVLAKGNLIIWFATLGSLSFGVINQIILKFYGGNESLGGYAAGWQIVVVATLFLSQISRIGNPAMARITKPGTSKKDKIRFLVKYSSVMCLVVCPISLVTIVWPESVLRLIYRPEYASGADALRVMGIYLMLFSLGIVASQYVISAKLEKTYFTSIIVGGILSIASCLVLIPRLAGYGAALALLIGHGISMGLYLVAMIQHIRKS
ncbi:MAG: oligosaccharide flippase family protein [Desulfobacterales bacterium]|nr:oligosaccharide flippase family protein [Desulfobacterales bacterium]